jgi:hypothetical protein
MLYPNTPRASNKFILLVRKCMNLGISAQRRSHVGPFIHHEVSLAILAKEGHYSVK